MPDLKVTADKIEYDLDQLGQRQEYLQRQFDQNDQYGVTQTQSQIQAINSRLGDECSILQTVLWEEPVKQSTGSA